MLNVFWERWKYCVNEILLPQRMKEIAANKFRAENLARLGFKLLIENILVRNTLAETVIKECYSYQFYRTAEAKVVEIAKKVQLSTAGEYFRIWREDYHSYHTHYEHLKELQNQYIVHRRWKTWRTAFLVSTILKRLTVKAIQHREGVLKLNSFRL